jgi:hypothetical protein
VPFFAILDPYYPRAPFVSESMFFSLQIVSPYNLRSQKKNFVKIVYYISISPKFKCQVQSYKLELIHLGKTTEQQSAKQVERDITPMIVTAIQGEYKEKKKNDQNVTYIKEKEPQNKSSIVNPAQLQCQNYPTEDKAFLKKLEAILEENSTIHIENIDHNRTYCQPNRSPRTQHRQIC